jgi:phospholipase C
MANGTTATDFRGIKRFVVLMLENRSFEHLLGFMKTTRPNVAGLSGSELNQRDPNSPSDPKIAVRRASTFTMPFDPAHEYYDVQVQLYGQ